VVEDETITEKFSHEDLADAPATPEVQAKLVARLTNLLRSLAPPPKRIGF